MDDWEAFARLGAALSIGLLIGLERGWEARNAGEGERVAGLRTYGLIGLLGGVTALLTEAWGALIAGMAFVALAGVAAAVYLKRAERDRGITSLVAAVLTLALGQLAGHGQIAPAASAAVVTTLLLGYKSALHAWVEQLEQRELMAGVKLLLISVVLLPVLPNRGYGPWNSLNPFEIWWMVVLIATLSFAGYIAIRLFGQRRGMLVTGLFGGLASSTAVTLQLARHARNLPRPAIPGAAAGILLACGTMFVRMLAVAGIIRPSLIGPLLPAAAVMTLVTWLAAGFYLQHGRRNEAGEQTELRNPLELGTAVGFGLLLAMIMLLSRGLTHLLGDAGAWLLAAASGLADVDAITLSLARMSADGITVPSVAIGIVIAAVANSLTKSVIAILAGGRAVGLRVAPPLLAAGACGLLALWWTLA